MADRHRRGEAVAALAAAALALAACGTQTEEDPSLSIGPTGPTEAGTATGEPVPTGEAAATTAPTPTPSAAGPSDTRSPTGTDGPVRATNGTATTDGSPTTDGQDTADAPVTSTDDDTGQAGPEDSSGSLPEVADAIWRQEPTGGAQLLVDDVRLGLQDGFDRVVLDLTGPGEVGWQVAYVEDPALDGSGIPVVLAGDHVLQVSARGMAYPEAGDTTYDGLLLVDAGDLTTVTEVLRAVPFEGQVQVYVGTRERAPFRVFRLSDPERLVVDVQHP